LDAEEANDRNQSEYDPDAGRKRDRADTDGGVDPNVSSARQVQEVQRTQQPQASEPNE
jgi:hypothetical protein